MQQWGEIFGVPSGVPKLPNEVTSGGFVVLGSSCSQSGYLGNRCSIHLSYGANRWVTAILRNPFY